jgi:hypothetical protein
MGKTVYDNLAELLDGIDVECQGCYENKGHHSAEGLHCPVVDEGFKLNKTRQFTVEVFK